MYYINNFSVKNDVIELIKDEMNSGESNGDVFTENANDLSKHVFCQADLWNVQRHMKAVHVTDRFPRTWEGL